MWNFFVWLHYSAPQWLSHTHQKVPKWIPRDAQTKKKCYVSVLISILKNTFKTLFWLVDWNGFMAHAFISLGERWFAIKVFWVRNMVTEQIHLVSQGTPVFSKTKMFTQLLLSQQYSHAYILSARWERLLLLNNKKSFGSTLPLLLFGDISFSRAQCCSASCGTKWYYSDWCTTLEVWLNNVEKKNRIYDEKSTIELGHEMNRDATGVHCILNFFFLFVFWFLFSNLL